MGKLCICACCVAREQTKETSLKRHLSRKMLEELIHNNRIVRLGHSGFLFSECAQCLTERGCSTGQIVCYYSLFVNIPSCDRTRSRHRWRLYRLWSVEDFIFVTVNAIWTVGVDACAVRQGKHTRKYCSDLGDLRSVIMHTNNNKMYQHF